MVTRLVIFICFFFAAQGCSSSQSTVVVSISGELFTLELVVNNQSRSNGYMNRESFPDHTGMLFVFPNSIERSFWMKNCLIDIDLIFLDSRGTITSLHEMPYEEPQSDSETEWEYEQRLQHYWSYRPARFAIELASGSIHRLNLRVNDHVALDLPLIKKMAR